MRRFAAGGSPPFPNGGEIAERLQRYKRLATSPPSGNGGERKAQPEVASPLIVHSSQCAVRNDDRAGVMRRLEKNPKDFLIREIRNKWKVKIKNS
jgi:hypothetical protein